MANKYKPNFDLFLSNDDEKSNVDIALEGLLSDTSRQYKSNDIMFNVKNIKYEDIEENKYDKFSKEHVEFLMESIKNEGLKEPITVYKKNKKYIILSGHSRFQAIKKIREEDNSQFNSIPCNVVEHTFTNGIDEKKLLAEYNQGREKTNRDRFLEYTTYFDYYNEHKDELKKKNITRREYISYNMGISKDMVSRYSTIEKKCIPEIKEIMLDGIITIQLTKAISLLLNKEQEYIFQTALNKYNKENNGEINKELLGEYIFDIYNDEFKNKSTYNKEKTLDDNIENETNELKVQNNSNELNNIDEQKSEINYNNTPQDNIDVDNIDIENNIQNHSSEIEKVEINNTDNNIVKDIDNTNNDIINNTDTDNIDSSKQIIFSLEEIKSHIPLAYVDSIEKTKQYIFNLIIKAEEDF